MNHITTWVNGSHGIRNKLIFKGDWTSMAILSDGSYGVPKGLICSFPVIVENGNYQIVKN
jgi:malate/lactate dehydrogenase